MKFSTISNPTLLLTALGLVLALPACKPRPPVAPPGADSCATGRWIGIAATPGSCPAVAGGTSSGWTTRPLFAGGGTVSAGGYCLYQNADPNLGAELDPLVDTGALARVGPDCADIVMAGELMQTLSPSLAQQFSTQAGAVPLPAATGNDAGSVRLAVLDTSPFADAPPYVGNVDHGPSLAYLARELLCQAGDESCAAQVATRLALPLSFGGEELAGGGYFGTKGQLAEAIHEEMVAWVDSGDADRLVLNLSLGWIPRPGESDGESLGPDGQAVFDVLQEAACRGVLTVVAVGNLGSGPEPAAGPVLPAAWYGEQTPAEVERADGSTMACAERGDPLLYPVSAVDSRGLRLSNYRPDTESARVAFGSHAVTSHVIDDDDQWTSILTGSSVSTVVLSATAAAVWHYDTSLSRRDLMDRLETAGDPLPRQAHLGSGPVRRVSLCRAVEEILGDPDVCYAAGLPSWSPTPPVLAYSAADWPLYEKSVSAEVPEQAVPDACPDPPDAKYFSETVDPEPHLVCPFQKLGGVDVFADEWTFPAPEDIPCPTCPLIKDPDEEASSQAFAMQDQDLGCPEAIQEPYTLFIEIDENYEGGTLTDATLRIGADGNDTFYLLDVGEGLDAENNRHLEVPCIEGKDIDPQTSTADLTFATTEHGSVMNVVPISGG